MRKQEESEKRNIAQTKGNTNLKIGNTTGTIGNTNPTLQPPEHQY